jgi:TrmH family RNA methyltransferase
VTKISSRGNPLFKTLLKLAQSARERRKAGLALLEGVHLAQVYLQAVGLPQTVVVAEAQLRNPEIERLLARLESTQTVVLPEALFAQLSTLASPAGLLSVIATPAPPALLPEQMDCCLILEDLQDPGNLGSILRSAAGAAIRHVVLSPHCVHAWSPRVVRAAMGAHFLLQIHEQADLVQVLAGFKGRVVATGTQGGSPVFDAALTGRLALLIGNEGAGLSQPLLAAADEIVCIPMPGGTESLNAAAAAAICLFERVRQQLLQR